MAATLLRKLRAFVRCIAGPQDSDSESDYAPAADEGLSSPPPPLPDADDIVREILVRLPPLPSSLPVASLVCKRWRRLLTDPQFLRRFRSHHRSSTPPLLGFFFCISGRPGFFPTTPGVPGSGFTPAQGPGESWRALGCRHGLALFFDVTRQEAVVWDPVTSSQRRVACPSELQEINPRQHEHDTYNGAVLISGGDNGARTGHLPDDCSLSSFRLVLVRSNSQYTYVSACLYESESGKWGNVSSTSVPSPCLSLPAVLVGNVLYWLLHWSGGGILEFDTDSQSLGVTRIPSAVYVADALDFQLLRTNDRLLGLAILSKQSIHLWGSKTFADGAVEWELQKSVELDKILSPKPSWDKLGQWLTGILGYSEENNVILLATTTGAFMIQLETMQFRIFFSDHLVTTCYPYTNFYTAVGGGDDRDEI